MSKSQLTALLILLRKYNSSIPDSNKLENGLLYRFKKNLVFLDFYAEK